MTPEQATYSIGVAARMSGLSVHALRMWERRYQLALSQRTASGQRAYSLADIEHLKLLKTLTSRGVRIGDIAKLPANQLMSLLIDEGKPANSELKTLFEVLVFDQSSMTLCRKVKTQFPQCAFIDLTEQASEGTTEHRLSQISQFQRAQEGQEKHPLKATIVVASVPSVQPSMLKVLHELADRFESVLIGANYINPQVQDLLKTSNLDFFKPDQDGGLTQALQARVLESLMPTLNGAHSERDSIQKHASRPHLFSESQLAQIELQKHLLDCECPPHIVTLIRNLAAFETYSRECEVENEHQALVHACVYSYTAQARYLMEKALVAVSAGHGSGSKPQ